MNMWRLERYCPVAGHAAACQYRPYVLAGAVSNLAIGLGYTVSSRLQQHALSAQLMNGFDNNSQIVGVAAAMVGLEAYNDLTSAAAATAASPAAAAKRGKRNMLIGAWEAVG